MNLLIDFKADWHKILRRVTKSELDIDLGAADSKDVPVLYFNAIQRRISARPRTIHIADTFHCPEELQEGWVAVQALIEGGADLTAHLSKLVAKAGCTDGLLNDWGVHHLHLGGTVKKGWVPRTGRLLFARVTPDAFYAIGIFDHDAWVDGEIVETIHRNWPSTIAQWKLNNVAGEQLTVEHRSALRSKNTNSFFLTTDNVTYGPIGGGMVASGHNLFAVISMDKFHDLLERLEVRLRETAPEIWPHLAARGCSLEAEIRAELVLTEGYYSALFPDFGLLVNFYPREAGEGGVHP